MVNPYSDTDFFGFFKIFFLRLLNGSFFSSPLATDEVQILTMIAVGASGALVGSFLILRNMTMVANALSHTILVGIISAFLLLSFFLEITPSLESLSIELLVIASLLSGVMTTLLTEFLKKVIGLQEDASIGLVFTSLFALGILLVTLFTKNLHLGTELVMGNVDALTVTDLKVVFKVLLLNSLIFLLFFKEFKLTTFDRNLSHSLGFSPAFFNTLLMVLTAFTIMGAFRAVGVLMVLSFFVGPSLTARIWTHRLSHLLLLSSVIGTLAAICGVALSRHLLSALGHGLSTSGLVVIVILLFFLSSISLKRFC